MYKNTHGMTLLELLIALVLLSLIALGFTGLHSFSHYQVISSERQTKIQNEVSFCLAHMTKEISKAIGNERVDGLYSVINELDIGSDKAIRAYIDANKNGWRDSPPDDYWIAYLLTSAGQLQHCQQCTDSDCTTCILNDSLSTKIANFNINVLRVEPTATNCPNCLIDNYVEITLTGRWQPGQGVSVDNPEITMRNRIKMPSVSTN
jgi:prepilin-type N-terminal cleavage/methylation domain-containing protein